jgi:hypothetical protein
LTPHPADRPQSAGEVRAALTALGERPAALARRPGNGYELLERLAGDVHVGREQEVDELCEAVDRAVGGHGSVVVVAGEAGMG